MTDSANATPDLGAVSQAAPVFSHEDLRIGEIVQLSPVNCRNPMFGGCLMVVTEPKSEGALGYVQALGRDEKIGGQAYYRATWAEMDRTGGQIAWVVE